MVNHTIHTCNSRVRFPLSAPSYLSHYPSISYGMLQSILSNVSYDMQHISISLSFPISPIISTIISFSLALATYTTYTSYYFKKQNKYLFITNISYFIVVFIFIFIIYNFYLIQLYTIIYNYIQLYTII